MSNTQRYANAPLRAVDLQCPKCNSPMYFTFLACGAVVDEYAYKCCHCGNQETHVVEKRAADLDRPVGHSPQSGTSV
jgi:hypothetical protein